MPIRGTRIASNVSRGRQFVKMKITTILVMCLLMISGCAKHTIDIALPSSSSGVGPSSTTMPNSFIYTTNWYQPNVRGQVYIVNSPISALEKIIFLYPQGGSEGVPFTNTMVGLENLGPIAYHQFCYGDMVIQNGTITFSNFTRVNLPYGDCTQINGTFNYQIISNGDGTYNLDIYQ